MEKKALVYEGKAKKVYSTEDENLYIVDYKDDATAFNGVKKGTISGKGIINNKMSNIIFKYLEDCGINTHFVKELSDRETLVKKVEIIPIEVVVRNASAGSFSKRFGVEEGEVFKSPIMEFSYKNDKLGDPVITSGEAISMGIASQSDIDTITEMAFIINMYMRSFFNKRGLKLIDFKLEFGKTNGMIILADEFSPDTSRLWDEKTNNKLDKDRFRRDLGGVEEAYNEVFRRISE